MVVDFTWIVQNNYEVNKMKYAIIDLGSNTVRLSVYTVVENQEFRLLFSEKETAGLANYVEEKALSREGMEKAGFVINTFLNLLRQLSIENIYIFATASLRNIVNAEQAAQYLKENTGVDVDIVLGKDEAEYSFAGALNTVDIDTGVMFDIGGGSTEIVAFTNRKPLTAQSFNCGCLNLANRYIRKIFPTKEELKQIKEKIRKTFAGLTYQERTERLCGVGGTIRAILQIVNVYFEKDKDNTVITAEEFKKIKKVLLQKDETAKKLILRTSPDRIHTIISGICIVDALVKRFDAKEIFVSRYGVREGYLCRKILANMT